MPTTLDFLGAFATGVAGWFGTHYLGAPILKLSQLRQGIHEELFFTSSIGWVNANGSITPAEKDRHDAAVIQIRRLAAQLSALHSTWPRYLNGYLSYRRLDLDKAVKGLTGLSNALADPADKTRFTSQIEDALSLPRSYSEEMLKDLQAAQRRRHERAYERNEPL